MRLSISQRLILLICGSALTLFIVGAMGFHNSQQLSEELNFTHDHIISSLNTLSNAQSAFLLIRVNALYHLYYEDINDKKPHEEVIQKKIGEIQALLSDYEKLATDAQDKALLDNDKQQFASYVEALNQVLNHSRANDKVAANEVIENEWKPKGNNLTQAFHDHVQFNNNLAGETVAGASKTGKRNSIITFIVMLIGLLLTTGIGLILRTRISQALQRLRNTLLTVAQQLDFTQRMPIQAQDEIGQTAQAFNQLLERVQGNIRTVADTASQVAQAASQMAHSSEQVARASQQQSEAAAQMSSAVDQMSASIAQVGERASDAHHYASESGTLAHEGEKTIDLTTREINQAADAVTLAADHIGELETQSQQVAGVLAVIKEVAEQTNLLALNAAIEAARAGEQGRGFAVVADEVRKLAERTASSTQEIAQTIELMRNGAHDAVSTMQKVVTQVSSSAERAGAANQVMGKIGAGSRNGVAMADEIVTAIREQSTASQGLAKRIEDVAQMAEESSSASRQSAHSARDLDQLAQGLQKVVGSYRL